MGRLTGKTCLVTAAAQGIGRASVEAFLREDDDDTGLRLLLEPMFGTGVWKGAKVNPFEGS